MPNKYGRLGDCGSCRFWQRYGPTNEVVTAFGECLRFPAIPTYDAGLERLNYERSQMRQDDWCGEYECP